MVKDTVVEEKGSGKLVAQAVATKSAAIRDSMAAARKAQDLITVKAPKAPVLDIDQIMAMADFSGTKPGSICK